MRTAEESDTIRVLLTGFGPFPRVAVNASTRLAAELAALAPTRWPGAHLHVASLPTEWSRGLADLDRLWSDHAPHLALHFGVSERAEGLVIERTAHNACGVEMDACGACADADVLQADGPPQLTARHDLAPLHARLAHARIPSCISDDPGRYLCNAVYFHSLARAAAAATTPAPAALFIHIPACLAVDAEGRAALDCPLDWPAAVDGAALILDHLLEPLSTSQRTAPRTTPASIG